MQQGKLWITGVVQGVGFRPFCSRTALKLGLTGTVCNTSSGVEVVLEGEEKIIDEFIRILQKELPCAAEIKDMQIARTLIGERIHDRFVILESLKSEQQRVLIPADLSVCDDCVREMNEPSNRRFRYPFINCTVCGPRYSIIQALPYDRPLTTMAPFKMCPDCEREYNDPADRRYHAQPNACPVCGPKLKLFDIQGGLLCEGEEALKRLSCEISKGKLLAVKGIGGFHIACLPGEDVVLELRKRKFRPDKPFALMVRNLASATGTVQLSEEARELLTSPQRPIVLCPASENTLHMSSWLAPGQTRLGIMLPYTPLHYLLMRDFEALLMTSANISDAPIVSGDREAFSELKNIVDFVVSHDREIFTPIDDSVLALAESRKIFLRRARGYVPRPLSLPFEIPDILAAGAQLKSTYALARGTVLFPGQYLGDLEQLGTVAYYRRSLEHFMKLYEIEPKIVACDKHPGYVATDLAKTFCSPQVEVFPVQHHHAHLASLLLDAGHPDPAIGVIFDGTGYGDDGTVWGGEFLVGDMRSFRRMGALYPCPLPGGERSIREPWRYALALMKTALSEKEALETGLSLWPRYEGIIPPILDTMDDALRTTSCGRLFDGVSALLGFCTTATYDGQAAMLLENNAEGDAALSFDILDDGAFVMLDWRRAIRKLVFSSDKKESLAAAFHAGLASAVAEICTLLREKTGLNHVALSGGVWQNTLLHTLTCSELLRRNFVPLIHRDISPNDEGVSVGQAIVAAYNIFRGSEGIR